MSIFTESEWAQARLFGRLIFANPFTEERTQVEQRLLGRRHITLYRVWHSVNGDLSVNKNLAGLNELCDDLVRKGLSRWQAEAASMNASEREAWDLLGLFWLFGKYSGPMCRNIYLEENAEAENARLYDAFLEDFRRIMQPPARAVPSPYMPDTIFALFHQIHRAFNYIFDFIAGGSLAAGRLRAAIWQSIFTCDLIRYYLQLHDRMDEFTTLITGESGTGKELAARAIAFSQFIPFDATAHSFTHFYRNCFHPIQLSAMPQSLLESELFGHVRGAFTGAVEERHGYFEACQPCESIFLDEIGDVSLETQVKLLRLLQTRQFHRIGSTETLHFHGKVIAATNADLAARCEAGAFRKDLLFRICSDTIHTEPLRTLIDGKAEELHQFVIVLARRLMDEEHAASFADRCCEWIVSHLGLDYAWPGNVRELEQCLRNLLLRGDYKPMLHSQNPATASQFLENCTLTADELMRQYVAAMHRRLGNASAVSRATGLDRRTVKKYLE